MRTNAHGDTPQGSPGHSSRESQGRPQQVVPNSEMHTSGGLGSALCRVVDLSSKPACPHSVCTEQSPQDTQALAAEVSSDSRDTARGPPPPDGWWVGVWQDGLEPSSSQPQSEGCARLYRPTYQSTYRHLLALFSPQHNAAGVPHFANRP